MTKTLEEVLARAAGVRETQRQREGQVKADVVAAESLPRQMPLFHEDLRAISNVRPRRSHLES